MKFLFWNTYKNRNIDQVISNIAWEYKINIIVLAEYNGEILHLLSRLKANGLKMRKYLSIGCDRITILGNAFNVKAGMQQQKYSIQIINNDTILCGLHLPSQLAPGSDDRRKILTKQIICDIESCEERLSTKKTILVGDFNEDPYNSSCLSAMYFHGLPSRGDALREKRIVEGTEFSMFYNPMWNLFGDFHNPPGTYYYSSGIVETPYWHLFDQVMIRPNLMDAFVDDSLLIVTKAGIDSLLDSKGHPNKQYSDHLPIVFEIKEM